jgi:hypothetical protein
VFPKNYIPQIPFPGFKWKWASLQCTEGINDPVVLLGVLLRMRKLEKKDLKYSSPEFAKELEELSEDIKDSVGIKLSSRVGERNLIRNSGQYWRSVGLIEDGDRSGLIRLTDFGRRVADHDISQTEFAAITVQTFKLPNHKIQKTEECQAWFKHDLILYPLRIILNVLRELERHGQGYITPEELGKIIIPLSGCHSEICDYVNFILWFRLEEISLVGWPDCCPSANDHRIVREYLLFLSHYGYTIKNEGGTNRNERYAYNAKLDAEITEILAKQPKTEALRDAIIDIQKTDIASEIERKRVDYLKTSRPNQARFRKAVLQACGRCVITNVSMPEVLEAAHIKPFKYNGDDTAENGFAMRMDIHLLFDAGHLRISENGEVQLSTRARMDYGAAIPPLIVVPNYINKEFLRWRWENYNGV